MNYILPHAAKCIKLSASIFILKLYIFFRISVHNDSEKFILLMQSNDAHVITWMAKFVYRSMIKRSDILLSEVQEHDETLG